MTRTVGSVEYKVVEGTLADMPTFNADVESAVRDGYAILSDGPTIINGGTGIEQTMFKGQAETFIAEYPINAVSSNSFTVAGNQTLDFNPGYKFGVQSSTGNDGGYTVLSSTTTNRAVSYNITAV